MAEPTTFFTQAELEAWTGLGAADFRIDGTEMTALQWTAYYETLEVTIRKGICTYCRRSSFFPTDYTELHDGRGPSDWQRTYREVDRKVLLIEQPVISIIKVEEDVASKGSPAIWREREARSDTIGGDYTLVTRGSYAYLRYHNNVPRSGVNVVRVTYTAGYPEGDGIYDDLRGIALDIASKHIQRKKKLQEAGAARQTATRDAADMFPIGDPKLLTDDIKTRLNPYVRARVGGRAWR
jgi:hypothetical protein